VNREARADPKRRPARLVSNPKATIQGNCVTSTRSPNSLLRSASPFLGSNRLPRFLRRCHSPRVLLLPRFSCPSLGSLFLQSVFQLPLRHPSSPGLSSFPIFSPRTFLPLDFFTCFFLAFFFHVYSSFLKWTNGSWSPASSQFPMDRC